MKCQTKKCFFLKNKTKKCSSEATRTYQSIQSARPTQELLLVVKLAYLKSSFKLIMGHEARGAHIFFADYCFSSTRFKSATAFIQFKIVHTQSQYSILPLFSPQNYPYTKKKTTDGPAVAARPSICWVRLGGLISWLGP